VTEEHIVQVLEQLSVSFVQRTVTAAMALSHLLHVVLGLSLTVTDYIPPLSAVIAPWEIIVSLDLARLLAPLALIIHSLVEQLY
jgi:hypothetical protein